MLACTKISARSGDPQSAHAQAHGGLHSNLQMQLCIGIKRSIDQATRVLLRDYRIDIL
jgi:hypothetical protein